MTIRASDPIRQKQAAKIAEDKAAHAAKQKAQADAAASETVRGMASRAPAIARPFLMVRASDIDGQVSSWRNDLGVVATKMEALDPERKKLVAKCHAGVDLLVDICEEVGRRVFRRFARNGQAFTDRVGSELATAASANYSGTVAANDERMIVGRVTEELLYGCAMRVFEWDTPDPASAKTEATEKALAVRDLLQQAPVTLESQRLSFLRPSYLDGDRSGLDILAIGHLERYVGSLGTLAGVKWIGLEIRQAIADRESPDRAIAQKATARLPMLELAGRPYLNGVISELPRLLVGAASTRSGGGEGRLREGDITRATTEARRLLATLDELVEARVPPSIAAAAALVQALTATFRDVASKASLRLMSAEQFASAFMPGATDGLGASSSGGVLAKHEALAWDVDPAYAIRHALSPTYRAALLSRRVPTTTGL